MRRNRRGRGVALPLRGAPFQPLGVGRLVRLAHLRKRSALRSSRFRRCAWLAPSRAWLCLVRYAPRSWADPRPLAAKGAALRSSAVAPAAPHESGVRSGLRPQRAFLSAGAWCCPCRKERSFVGVQTTVACGRTPFGRTPTTTRRFNYSGGGWFASYVRGAVLRGVLRAGSPAPRLCGSGVPRPFSPSPLPSVAPPQGRGGFGRAVSRYAGRSFRLTPCACICRVQAQGSRAYWRYFKIVLHRLSHYPLSFDIRRCKRFQNNDAPTLTVAPAPFWSFLVRASRSPPTHHPFCHGGFAPKPPVFNQWYRLLGHLRHKYL